MEERINMEFIDDEVQQLYNDIKKIKECHTEDTQWDKEFRIACQTCLDIITQTFMFRVKEISR